MYLLKQQNVQPSLWASKLIGLAFFSLFSTTASAASSYVEGAWYRAGDVVIGVGGDSYRCKSEPAGRWCAQASYRPGQPGGIWENAWERLDNDQLSLDFTRELAEVPAHCLPLPGRMPAWVADNDPILDQAYYQNWLKTTTTLCVNLKNAEEENRKPHPNSFKEIAWITNNPERWLFSGSEIGRKPEEAFNVGLVPGNPDGGHLGMFRGPSDASISGIIYTTYRGSYAAEYGRYVYAIDPHAPGGVNTDASFDYMTIQDEIDFFGGISAQYLRGVYVQTMNADGSFGMPFERYIPNPNYLNQDKYPAPEQDQIELLVSKGQDRSTGTLPDNSYLTIDGEAEGNGIHMLSKDKMIKVQSFNADGTPNINTRWWVNGFTGEKLTSCIFVPTSDKIAVDQHMILSAMTIMPFGGDGGSDECISLQLDPIQDMQFMGHKDFSNDYQAEFISGIFGGWNAIKTVMLNSQLVSQLAQGQSIDLNDNVDSFSNGIPGMIEQRVHAQMGKNWRLTFRASNNVRPGCINYLGEQKFKVAFLADRLHGFPTEVLKEVSFVIPPATQVLPSGWLPSEWKTYTVVPPKFIDNAMFTEHRHPRLQFVSTSEQHGEKAACGALITDVKFSPIDDASQMVTDTVQ